MEPLEATIYRHYLNSTSFTPEANPKEPWEVSFEILARHYESFLFDGFGTLYNHGGHVYPGALECLAELRRMGKNIRLVTNAASRPVSALQEELATMGFDLQTHEIISSGDLLPILNTALHLKQAFYLGKPDGESFLQEAGIEPVSDPETPTVILSLSLPESDPRLAQARNILQRPNGQLIVLNPDAWAPKSDGTRIPVSGTQAYELVQQTGCQVLYCGKPFPLIFQVAMRSLIPSTGSVIMIGDTLGTDIAGANLAGIDSALLLGRNTAEYSVRDDQYLLGVRPTYVLRDLQMPTA